MPWSWWSQQCPSCACQTGTKLRAVPFQSLSQGYFHASVQPPTARYLGHDSQKHLLDPCFVLPLNTKHACVLPKHSSHAPTSLPGPYPLVKALSVQPVTLWPAPIVTFHPRGDTELASALLAARRAESLDDLMTVLPTALRIVGNLYPGVLRNASVYSASLPPQIIRAPRLVQTLPTPRIQAK